MNIKKLKLLSILVVVFGFLCSNVFGAGIPDKSNRQKDMTLMKPTGTPLYQILNINNITTWMRADGQQNHSPTSDNGSLYPRGTKWVIYQDGFVWGGKAYLDAGLSQPAPAQLIRVGGQTYNIGTRAGRIIGTGAAAVAQSPADADVRIYRVRRDFAQMDIQELTQDAAESFEIPASSVTKSHTDQIAAQYAKDWDEWPVGFGAPYVERNGAAGYQKPKPFNYDVTKGPIFNTDSLIAGNYDEPGLAGADPNSPADQVIWTVINDLDRSASTGLFGSEPLGLEAQITMWGYKRTDAMGNLYFKKIKFINKGGIDIGGGTKGSFHIDSMFFSQFSDPDLGSYGDDLCGVDMNLFPAGTGKPISLGYVYNGNAIDAEFKKFGLQPPAVGYDFLQGPLVPGAPTDSGVFNLKRVYGKKNLPMTSFAYFSAGSGISDPAFTYEGGLRWWRMLQGYVPDASTAPWRLYPHPSGVPETKFPLNGDPVARTGFIDGAGTTWSLAPGDRRIVLNTGPFTLAPGDTQEVVVGTVAGLGADRLSSINVMKFYDQFVQTTYDALFQVTPSPASPAVKIAELDGEVTLEWGSDFSAVKKTENTVSQPGAFVFEGYNVYQLPSRSASLSEAKRLATYDLLTAPTVILDRQFDKRSGEILMLPVQFGTNSGITRHFQFTRDYILDIDKLNNGQEYYLAVTAYSRTTVPDFLPTSLESSPIVYTVRPQSPQGVRYAGKYGVNASFINVGPFTDGFVKGKVVDPKQTTGNLYEVSFKADVGAPGGFTWSLRDSVKKTTWGPYNNLGIALGGDIYDYPIIDGIFWEVAGPPNEVNDCVIGKRGTFLRDSASNYSGMATTSGGTGPIWVGEGGAGIFGGVTTSRAKMADMKNVYIVFDETVPAAQRMAYRYVRAGQGAKADSRFADPPYGRTTYTTTSWGYCDTMPVPFRAFRYDPDAGITTPIQLAVGFSENNVLVANGWVDGRYTPTNVGDGGREFLIVFGKPYDATMNQDEYKWNVLGAAIQTNPYGGQGWHDAHFVFWLKNSRKFDLTDATAFPAGSAVPRIWSNPDTIFMTANHVLTAAVKFIVQSPVSTASLELAKADAEKVGVYPNPYYAFNPAETNRFVRFVTFNKLPAKATVRIFNLAGQLVRTLTKEDPSQFLRWDLNNEHNFPVASGIYVAHVDMPDVGVTKILKVAIIQEQEVPDVF